MNNALSLKKAAEVAPIIGVPNAAAVLRLARRRVIPFLKLGYHQYRFDVEAVKKALEKREMKAL